jgi:hypothetical protein
MVITKITTRPARKENSARVSYITARCDLLRMERNAHKQLNINITKQPRVISSMKEVSVSLKNLSDVRTKKQNPRKFEEEFNISGDLVSLSFMPKDYSFIQIASFAIKFHGES